MERVNRVMELVVVIVSMIVGISLICKSIYFIYGYHFTSALWFFMYPMTTLVTNLVVGCLLVISAGFSFANKTKGGCLFRQTGIFVIVYSININLLVFFNDSWYLSTLYDSIVCFLLGIVLYLFFAQKKYAVENKIIKKLVLSVIVFLLIDFAFNNWEPSEMRQLF